MIRDNYLSYNFLNLNMKWLIPVVILSIFLIAGCIQEQPATLNLYSCSQDTDCIKVAGGCCDCGGGGNATTINKNFESEWKDKLSNKCKDIGCAAVMSDDPTCFKTAKCVENKCVLE